MYLHCLMRWVEGCRSELSLGLCTGQAAWFLLEGASPTPKLLLLQDQSNLLYQSPAAPLHMFGLTLRKSQGVGRAASLHCYFW